MPVKSREQLFLEAARDNDFVKAKKMANIKKGKRKLPNLSVQDDLQWTALCYFVAHAQEAAVTFFLEKTPDVVNMANWLGWTPLHYAVYQNNVALVRLLLAAGANKECRSVIEFKGYDANSSPFDIACLSGIDEIKQALGVSADISTDRFPIHSLSSISELASLAKVDTLRSLNLRNQLFTKAEFNYFLKALKYSSILAELDLSFCRLGDKGAALLCSHLRINGLTIYFDNNEVSNAKPWRKIMPLLHGLSLEGNKLGGSAASHLAAGLQESELRWLNLTANPIGDQGFRYFRHVLKRRSSLKAISFEHNNITARYAEKLSKMLVVNSDLLSLNLSRNLLRDEGLGFLIQGLKGNSTLKQLDISYNDITSVGLQHLAIFLQTRDANIERLDISGNTAEAEGLVEILNAIKNNKQLTQLALRNYHVSPIPPSILSALSRLLASGQCFLEKLDLSDNNLGDRGALSIINALSRSHLKVLKCSSSNLM